MIAIHQQYHYNQLKKLTNGVYERTNTCTLGVIPKSEREALVSLYNGTDGENWTHNSGWNGSIENECNWHGVTCTNDSVTELSLLSNKLKGNIPAELGNLTNLRNLNLYGNQISGNIPAELSNIADLRILDLGWNQLTGNFPTELLNLTSLQVLLLRGNQFTGGHPRTARGTHLDHPAVELGAQCHHACSLGAPAYDHLALDVFTRGPVPSWL